MVTLDVYRLRRLGYNGVIDDCLHHNKAMFEDVVGVSEQGEGAQRFQIKWICHDYT